MNFKKYIVAASLVTFGLVGCASHATAPVAVAPPPPAPVVVAAPVAPAAPAAPEPPKDPSFKVTVNGASLTFPNDSWEKMIEQDGVAIVGNDDAEVKIMIGGDSFKGPASAWDKLIVGMVTKSGGKVVSTKKVQLGGTDAVFHDTVAKNKLHVYVWTITNDSNAWLIQCGSPSNPDAQDICTSLANTLAIE